MNNVISNPLIVALDVDSDKEAINLADSLSDLVGAFKIGPRLIQRYGWSLTQEIAERAPLFVDCKFFDIPSTMEASVKAAFDSGATFATVHTLSGKEALLRLAKLEKQLNEQRPFKVLCVTILTSWDQNSFPENFKNLKPYEHVIKLVELAKSCGLTGIVCSPEELQYFKKEKDLFLVAPGIRATTAAMNDQKRTMTAKQAIASGASAIVVGRPIIQASEPRKTAYEFMKE